MKNRKGFTLIELLIVIAIIAVLSVVVILSLNPAELLRQARDSNRISDMSTLKSAIALYLADQASPYLGVTGTCYVSASSTSFATVTSTTGTWVAPAAANCQNWFSTAGPNASTSATSTRTIGVQTTTAAAPGNGWIPVDFANISSGSPIGQEPIDAVNSLGTASCVGTSPSLSNCSLFYSYIPGAGGTTFKLAAFMESTKYSKGGGGDVESTDGGINNYVFESGTSLAL